HWRNYVGATPLSNMWMRIYDPSGAEVQRYNFRDGDPGWIAAPGTSTSSFAQGYARAVNGPNGVDGVTNGYTPYIFTPTTTGEYSIVLYQSNTNGNTMTAATNHQKAPFWDITVANPTLPVGQQTQNGRLFSYNWSLVANSGFGSPLSP